MGWERRGKNRLVYYRKERYTDEQGRSRVRSIYCGSGERGSAAEREAQERREGARQRPAEIPEAPSLTQPDTDAAPSAILPTRAVTPSPGKSAYDWTVRLDYARAHPSSIKSPYTWMWLKPASEGDFDDAIRGWIEAGRPAEVLQGATPEAAGGATPQVVEEAVDGASAPRPDWYKYLANRRKPALKYRR